MRYVGNFNYYLPLGGAIEQMKCWFHDTTDLYIQHINKNSNSIKVTKVK